MKSTIIFHVIVQYDIQQANKASLAWPALWLGHHPIVVNVVDGLISVQLWMHVNCLCSYYRDCWSLYVVLSWLVLMYIKHSNSIAIVTRFLNSVDHTAILDALALHNHYIVRLYNLDLSITPSKLLKIAFQCTRRHGRPHEKEQRKWARVCRHVRRSTGRHCTRWPCSAYALGLQDASRVGRGIDQSHVGNYAHRPRLF